MAPRMSRLRTLQVAPLATTHLAMLYNRSKKYRRESKSFMSSYKKRTSRIKGRRYWVNCVGFRCIVGINDFE